MSREIFIFPRILPVHKRETIKSFLQLSDLNK
jgi:hypothetical protein